MNKKNNNLNEKELLEKVEYLIDNKDGNQKFTNSFLGFCSCLFSVKPKANTNFKLSLKQELLKTHSSQLKKGVESCANKQKSIKNKFLTINNLIIMNKKSILISIPTLVLAIIAIVVFQPFGPSVGKIVSGSSFIAQAKDFYEQNLGNSILHQTAKTYNGKDLKAYAKAANVSISKIRKEWVVGAEKEEYWMDSKHDLSKYNNQYNLFITNENGIEELYTNSDCKIIMFNQFSDNTEKIDIENISSGMMITGGTEEELLEYMKNSEKSEDEGCTTKYWSASNSEIEGLEASSTDENGISSFNAGTSKIDSPESYLKFMEQLVKAGEAEAYEYREGGKTLIAFEEKMFISYNDGFDEDTEAMSNIYSRLIFDKKTSEIVKYITVIKLNGIKYEISETKIKTEWLNPLENTDIFNPEKYKLKKVTRR